MRSGLLLFCLLVSCMGYAQVHDDPAPDSLTWLLQRHVTAEGKVNYHGFKRDSAVFYRYLAQLDSAMGRSLAFYINAYNALVIKSVIENDTILNNPYKSASVVQDKEFFTRPHLVAGRWFSLPELQRYLLDTYRDGRIALALCNGSVSSPALRNQAYDHRSIDQTLTEAAKKFVTSEVGLDFFDQDWKLVLNPIFKQLERDFAYGHNNNVLVFVKKYIGDLKKELRFNAAMKDKYDITYSRYNWDLNRQ